MIPKLKEGILKHLAPIARSGAVEARTKEKEQDEDQERPPEHEADGTEAKARKRTTEETAPLPDGAHALKPGLGLTGVSSALFKFSQRLLQKGRALSRYRGKGDASSSDLSQGKPRGKVIDENVD